MRKYLILLLLLLPFCAMAKKQGQELLDSLVSALPQAKDDTARIGIYMKICVAESMIDPDAGVKYGAQSLALATKMSWTQGIGRSHNAMGLNYMSKGENPEAIERFTIAEGIFEKIGYTKGLIMVRGNFANVYSAQGDYPKALEYYFKVLKYHQDDADKAGIARATGNIGIVYSRQGSYTKALDYFFSALNMDRESGDKSAIANDYERIGVVYKQLGNYPKALEYIFMALKGHEELGNKRAIAEANLSIGSIFTDKQANAAKALEYELRGLKIHQEIGNKEGMSFAYLLIGNSVSLQGNDTAALRYYRMSFELCRENGNRKGIAEGLSNMGAIYGRLGNNIMDIACSQRAVALFKEIGDMYSYAYGLEKLGSAYLTLAQDSLPSRSQLPGDLKELSPEVYNSYITVPSGRKAQAQAAILYLTEGLAIAENLHSVDMVSIFLLDITRACKITGDYQRALQSYERHTAINDSFYSARNTDKLNSLETQRMLLVKEKQIAADEKKSKERLYFGVGGIMLLLVIGALLYTYKVQRQANTFQNGLLAQKEELILQKDMLMKEIHHRVKNNLQVISTLLDLQLINITDPNAKDAITESATRLKSISLIHQKLYQDEDITTIECAQFATDLFAQVSSVFKKPAQQILFTNHMQSVLLDIDTAVPLGLMLNELMTNSYKYAFQGESGNIIITMEISGNEYKLLYSDSGPGLPAGMDTRLSGTLGMKILHSLSKQLRGAFTYIQATRTFCITFLDIDGRKMID